MRWDHLFNDLEAQLEHELGAEEQDIGAEEERFRLGRLGMCDRLFAAHAATADPVTITLSSGIRLRVRLDSFGRDWVSAQVIDGPVPQGQVLIPVAAISSVRLPVARVPASLAGDARVQASRTLRLGLPIVLRDLCRRRRAVDVVAQHATVHGTIDRVGRDHLDLALHESDSPRREVSEVLLLPLASLVAVAF